MASAQQLSEDRQAIAEGYVAEHGHPATLAELQILQANGDLESSGGRASYKLLDHATGKVVASSGVINNYGAVQTSEGPPNGFLATDTGPSHITAENPKGYYDHYYKVYPTKAAGAQHMIAHLTTKRPYSWAAMKEGDIDEWAERAHAAYIPGGVKKDPISGTPGYFEQKPSERAKGIEMRIAAQAASFGEAIAARRGGPMVDVVTQPAPAEGGGGGGDEGSGAGTALGVAGIAGALALFAKWFFGRRK